MKPQDQTHSPSEAPTRIETLSPQRAVQEYLDGLLLDATTKAREPAAPVAVETKVAAKVTTKVETKAEPVVEAKAPAVVQPRTPAPAAKAPPVSEVAAEAPAEPAADDWIDGRPAWAQRKFDCLLFRVAGLTLAVPLVELGGVLTLDQELTPLFGQPDWFLGLLPSKTGGTVKTIDTARWVMPERYDPKVRESLKYVILMQGSDWGMTCHEVADAITLEPHQVSWRTDRGRRPWLAGTVIEHMCAIMDVSALVRLVDKDSRRRGAAVDKA